MVTAAGTVIAALLLVRFTDREHQAVDAFGPRLTELHDSDDTTIVAAQI
jgi:hypothetical protein